MKKKFIAIAVLMLSICLCLTVSVRADETGNDTKQDSSVASVTNGSTTKYYDRIDAALAAVANDNATVKLLKSVTIPTSGGDNGYVVSRQDKKFTFDFNGYTITSTKDDGHGAFYITAGEITFVDSSSSKRGGIESTSKTGGALVVQKGSAILKGGTFKGADGASTAAIQVGGESNGNIGELTVEDGATVENGIYVTNKHATEAGKGSKLVVNGGTIIGKGSEFAVSGNGADTKHSTITINGGTLISDKGAAIYHPQEGELKITGGTIKGAVPVVVRQGNPVSITGGKFIATETDETEIRVGDAKGDSDGFAKVPTGYTIIVDNKSEGYGSDTTVSISGGEFEARSDVVFKSYDEDKELADFNVSGGAYNKPFEVGYIKAEGDAEVKIGSTYYVGSDATKAIKKAAKNKNSIIEVIKGNVTVTGAVPGVTVQNSGNGNVTVNGMKVTAEDEVVVPAPAKEEKDDTPNTGVDVFAVAGAILVVSALGVVVLKRK